MSERVLASGTIIDGKYVVEGVLGEGGFGITYLAKKMDSGERVAVKEYFPVHTAVRNNETGEVCVQAADGNEEEFLAASDNIEKSKKKSTTYNEYEKGLARFIKEADILREYRYLDGIVRVWDCFRCNNTAYIVMDYIEGLTLRKYISLHGSFEYFQLMDMLMPVMKSLVTLHKHGVIHRDISPDNLMIGMDNNMYLIDFGAAKEVDGDKTTTVLLKAGYAPPEQYLHDGDLGPWTDVYGLCASIYTALSGKVPADAVARLQGRPLEPVDIADGTVDHWRWCVIEKGMSIRHAQRFCNVSELITALTVEPGDDESATVYGDGKAPLYRYRIKTAFVMLIVLAGAGALVYGVMSYRGRDGSSDIVDNNAVTENLTTDNITTEDDLTTDNISTEKDIELCVMPDVTGLSESLALSRIKASDGSIIVRTIREYSSEVSSGYVISQNVEPDTHYNEGAISEMTITVSMGNEPTEQTVSTKQSVSGKKTRSTDSGSYNVESDGNESQDFYLDD